jgi:hypothetical protein
MFSMLATFGRVATVLSGTATVPAAAGRVVCDQKAMARILEPGYVVAPYERCTFKLFLDDTYTWTEDEWFHGDMFVNLLPVDVARLGWQWADIKQFYASLEYHFFWGKWGTPDAQMVEVTLKQTPIIHVDEALALEWDQIVGTFTQET